MLKELIRIRHFDRLIFHICIKQIYIYIYALKSLSMPFLSGRTVYILDLKEKEERKKIFNGTCEVQAS